MAKKDIKKKSTVKSTVKNPRTAGLMPPFKPGQSGNPEGRKLGQRNYATIYREALAALAKANNKTPEELEVMIEQVGLKKAFSGDFKFFQDFRDRIHGKPIQKQEVMLEGKLTINEEKRNKAKSAVRGFLSNRKDTR
jgi:hypothetical protein